MEKHENWQHEHKVLLPLAYVSIDWIALEKGLVLFGLLGDVEHASRVACQVPKRWVARDGAQPGGVLRSPHLGRHRQGTPERRN